MTQNSNGARKNFNRIKNIFLITFLFSMLFIPVLYVNAAKKAATSSDFGKGNLGTAVGGLYAGQEDLGTSIGNIISGVLALAGTIFLVLTVYGGITWMLAMGNQEKVEKARNIITAAIIGGAITGGAYAITFFVMGRIGGGGDKDKPSVCAGACQPATSVCPPGTKVDSGTCSGDIQQQCCIGE